MIELSPEERDGLRQEHLRGEHRRAMFGDCDLCHLELNEAMGWAGPIPPPGGRT